MIKKEKIILIGGGGHCLSCIDVIEQTGLYEIVGILDKAELRGQKVLDYTIIGTDEEIEHYIRLNYSFAITIGQIKDSSIRNRIFDRIQSGKGKLPIITSPLAYVSQHAQIGSGSIIMHHALINAGVTIGCAAIINTKALLEHEVSVGNFCHISTGAILNGQVKIGNHCFIGSHATINQNLELADQAIIASGARVSKSVLEGGIYK